MIGGQEAAYAVNECIKYKNPKFLKLARKRFKCTELKTNKVYLFHPYAEVQNM